MKKSVLVLTVLMVLIFVSNQLINACTVFHASNEHVALGGNNEDYNIFDTYIYFFPPSAHEYGRVIVGYSGSYWIQGGMNEKGLFWDGLAAPYLEVVNSSGKPYFNGHIGEYILSVCETCDEARTILNQYNMRILETAQLLIGDRYGDSFIIEGDIIHKKTEYFQVATNFYLSQWSPPYPCWRYNTAVEMFETNPVEELSVDFCTSVLDAVHQEGAYPTQYSTLYDLKEGLVYLYHDHNYHKVKIFNLTDEFAMGYHAYYIPDLFEKDNLPPLAPSKPSGSSSGTIGVEYRYTCTTYDPDGDDVYYVFAWGDGTESDWLGPYSSGAECSMTHTWNAQGNYAVKVKAKDINGAMGEWSNPLTVTMPKTYGTLFAMLLATLFNVLERLHESAIYHHCSPCNFPSLFTI